MVTGVTTALILLSAGCAPDPSDDPNALLSDVETSQPGVSVQVMVLDNTFRAGNIEIAPGTEVRWENTGRNAHDIRPVADPTTESWGVLEDQFQPGDSYSLVFTTPGTYAYYCSIHGTPERGMVGTVTVTGP